MSGIIADIWIPYIGAGNCSVKKGRQLLNISPGDTGFCTLNRRWLIPFVLSWLSLGPAIGYDGTELSDSRLLMLTKRLLGAAFPSSASPGLLRMQTRGRLLWLDENGRVTCLGDSLTYTSCRYACTYPSPRLSLLLHGQACQCWIGFMPRPRIKVAKCPWKRK